MNNKPPTIVFTATSILICASNFKTLTIYKILSTINFTCAEQIYGDTFSLLNPIFYR